jgi:nucleoside-diphosphate-sugar epimerase
MKPLATVDLEYVLQQTSHQWQAVKNKSVLLTGGTGFFGKWLVESFLHINRSLQLNASLTIISRQPETFLQQHPHLRTYNNLHFIQGDLLTIQSLPGTYQYIIHAATASDAAINTENPLLMLHTITEGTKKILDFAITQPIEGFLFTSSGAVYGKQPAHIQQIKETDGFFLDINNPLSAYAEGKRMAELLCAIYYKTYQLPISIARCFAFVGPHLPLNKHFAIGNFIGNVLQKQDIIVNGDGMPLRSYLYAADLAVWLFTILLKGSHNTPYNVGSDEAFSIADIAHKVAAHGSGCQVHIQQQASSHYATNRYIPAIDAAAALGLQVGIDIDSAIQKTIGYYA